MNSFPPLIPVPVPATSTKTNSIVNNDTEDEDLTDKFATLFSPPTPRASPTPTAPTSPVIFQPLKPTKPLDRPPLQTPMSPDSEFGSFVSVPPSEDPLASFGFFGSEADTDVETNTGVAGTGAAAGSLNQEGDTKGGDTPTNNKKKLRGHGKTASQTFFENFAQEARIAHERNQKGLMDEFLKADDPLFWGAASSPATPAAATASARGVEGKAGEGRDEAAAAASQTESRSLIDLDLDFSIPKQTESGSEDTAHSAHHHHHPSRAANFSSPFPLPQSPTRKSTLSLPHALAPPIASMPSVSSTPPTPAGETSESTDSLLETTTSKSPSYQTLSTISKSSKWMATLLPSYKSSSSPPPPPPPHGHGHSHSPSSTSDTLSPHPHPTSSSAPQTLRHAPTFPFPFTSSISTHPSPFAPHVFVPPSGAPGFRGEGYGWDKGYSNELERELLEGAGKGGVFSSVQGGEDADESRSRRRDDLRGEGEELVSRSEDTKPRSAPGSAPGSGLGSRARTPVGGGTVQGGTIGGIGGLIERKNGSVELSGRRDGTVGVLDVELADMLRTYLPALSRLPRTWTLLYSLDQHGISLHTLYDKCENPPVSKPKPRHASTTSVSASSSAPGFGSTFGSAYTFGAGSSKMSQIVVMKDSGDAVFGVFLGEGVRRSRGRGYFGSGESFLWKYLNGKLQVFKWTGRNDYVALCEQEYISFGGGDGTYGLYLDASLFEGTSARCPTFENEPLCSEGTKKGRSVEFECVGLEVWGVGP